VEITFKGQSYGFLNPLDLHVNCRVRRDHDRYLKWYIYRDCRF